MGPLLGSFITEPAAMTISALLLCRHVFERGPGARLRHGTLGLLFVNISVVGTLTRLAAPPVPMVAGECGWGLSFVPRVLGGRAAVGIAAATAAHALLFRKELAALAERPAPDASSEQQRPAAPIPAWAP